MLTVFLDLDGPLLDGKLRHHACYSSIISRHGGNILSIEQYWDMKRSMVNRHTLLEQSNFEGSYKVFFDEWMEKIEDPHFLSFDLVKPKAVETLASWKELGYKIVLVTMRHSRANLMIQLKSFNLLEFLDEVIDCPPFREQTKYQALKEYQYTKAVFVGDTEEDTKTAKMLSIPSIGITTGLRKKELLDADYFADEICNINLEALDLL